MNISEWFIAEVPDLAAIVLSCLVFYLLTIAVTRLVGLRSFTQFSSFDFLITLAMGALLASTVISKEIALSEGLTALASLFLFQILISYARVRWNFVRKWLDSQPVLLMVDGRVLHNNLRSARITEDELRAKLRANNLYSYDQVKAVVLESSGGISVIHQTPNLGRSFDTSLLDGVAREL